MWLKLVDFLFKDGLNHLFRDSIHYNYYYNVKIKYLNILFISILAEDDNPIIHIRTRQQSDWK